MIILDVRKLTYSQVSTMSIEMNGGRYPLR
jgi:hypothetical protein